MKINLHHANIVLGKNSREFIYKILEQDLGLKIEGSPDFFFLEQEVFSITDARNLEKWATLKPFIGDIKAAFIIVDSINWEAQNALLKVFEEPSLDTYFFINLPNLSGILPTFLSRVMILDQRSNEEKFVSATSFLKANIKERFSTVRTLVKREDKRDIKDLISSLESAAYHDKVPVDKMKKILISKVFASVRGGSPKMLLEWLSCVI